MPKAPACMASSSSRRISSISVGAGRPALVAHHLRPQAAEAHERGYVARRPRRVDGVEVLPELVPRRQLVCRRAEERRHRAQPGARPRRHAAVADHDRGHALAEGAVHPEVGEGREVGVGVDVDEAGGEREAGGVDGLRRLGRGLRGPRRPGLLRPTDLDDASAGDTDRAAPRGRAAAVDDKRVRDQEVQHTRDSTCLIDRGGPGRRG